MNKSILIVDDDPDILQAIKYTLEDVGYKIEVSKKGDEAEQLGTREKKLPKLIILDALLSGKDGWEICKKLKGEKISKNIPIIMISAHPDAGKLAKAAGADDFIAKPFHIETLIDKVRHYAK